MLPNEVWLDVFCYEDRDVLECLQLACGHFKRIIYEKMSKVCMRPIYGLHLANVEGSLLAVVVPELSGPEVFNPNSMEQATEWIFARLRSACVYGSFELYDVALGEHFFTQLKKAKPTFEMMGSLGLWFVSFRDDVTPATLIDAFPDISDVRSSQFQSTHIDDPLLRSFAEKGIWESFPQATKGVEYDRISEKGVLDFCFGYSEEASGSVRDLKLRKPKVTTEFVAILVKAHLSCGHDDPIRLEVADIPKQNQNVFDDFKQDTDTDGSFTALVTGDTALKVSYNAAEDTWLIQRGLD